MHKFLGCLLLILNGFIAYTQPIIQKNTYPLTDFRQPLDINPPALSGSFGEIRTNHFHSGIDFRTNQRQGYPVYAASEGYISRMRVQNSGFGLALYIRHPNGYTTVYGHLQRFNAKIGEKIKNIQYKLKSYEIDEYPLAEEIHIQKGEIIGWSGNSGSSGGPHLHFEIRDSKTEATINPQLFGVVVPDNVPPVISAMYVYRLNNKSFDEFTPKQYFQVKGGNGKYQLNKVSIVNLSGEVGFGIVATDRHTVLSGLNGIYSVLLEVDDKPVFNSVLEQFSFENTRGINTYIDYPAKQVLKTNIQKSFVDPGNPLKIYHNLINNGRIEFNDGKMHVVKYTISDVKGNKSELLFNVNATPKAVLKASNQPAGTLFPYNTTNEYKTQDIKVVLPKGTLYNDLNFTYKTTPKPTTNAFSSVHHIHNTFTPLHTGFELWIKPDSTLNAFSEKAVIVNTARVSQGGYFENGFVKAKPSAFGNYFIAIDTVPPTIHPLNIHSEKNMAGIGKMSFRIRDNLSGIKSFNGYIDGAWVLMEFDAKTATLWHSFDARTKSGKHTFELIVEDRKGNNKKYSVIFNK